MTTPTKHTGFVENEPAVVSHIVLGLLAILGEFVVGHTSLVTNSQWDTATTVLAPIVTAAVVAFSAWFWRRWLSPAWKVVEADLHKGGLTPEQEKLIVDHVRSTLIDALDQKLVIKATPEAVAALTPKPYPHDGVKG